MTQNLTTISSPPASTEELVDAINRAERITEVSVSFDVKAARESGDLPDPDTFNRDAFLDAAKAAAKRFNADTLTFSSTTTSTPPFEVRLTVFRKRGGGYSWRVNWVQADIGLLRSMFVMPKYRGRKLRLIATYLKHIATRKGRQEERDQWVRHIFKTTPVWTNAASDK